MICPKPKPVIVRSLTVAVLNLFCHTPTRAARALFTSDFERDPREDGFAGGWKATCEAPSGVASVRVELWAKCKGGEFLLDDAAIEEALTRSRSNFVPSPCEHTTYKSRAPVAKHR